MRNRKKKLFKRIVSCNVQGLNGEAKQRLLADDFFDNKFTFMMVQETKIQKNTQQTIESSCGKKLILYNSGHKSKSMKGVGFLVQENMKINFQAVCERICLAEIKIDNLKVFAISAYAPTEDETSKHPEETELFYNKLTTVVNKLSKRYTLIIGGDFNARTKLSDPAEQKQYSKVLGKYARNQANKNGKLLIEFCKMHNLQLVNTFFRHKPSQQITWEPAAKPSNNRRNPYRFQIDYIAIRKNQGVKVYDARSYNIMRINCPGGHKDFCSYNWQSLLKSSKIRLCYVADFQHMFWQLMLLHSNI